MKVGKRVSLVIGAGVLSPLLSLSTAAAILATGGSNPPARDNSQIRLAQAESETEPSTLEARLQRRKDALGTRLTTAQQTRLRARCKGAQTLITAQHGRAVAVQKSRINAYDRIQDHLTVLQEKLAGKVDTANLAAVAESLKEKSAALETKLANYLQALDDMQKMDCASDPAGFKASLDNARSLQAELASEAAEIRSFIKESLKPELQAIRQALQAKKGEVIN